MSKRVNPPPLTRALVQDNVPAQVMDGLWIGSIHAAFNQDSMQDRGITHVLNASGLPATFPRQFTYFTVDIRDKESSNILAAIGVVNIFVEAGIDRGGVLVHCAGGRSRSAAFIVAFIMSTEGCSYDAAFAKVRRARPVVSVNRGFEQQLRAYGAAQCDVYAAHQMMLRVRAATLLDRRNLLLLRRSSSSSSSEGGGAGGGTGAEGAEGGSTKLPPPMPSPHQSASSLLSTVRAPGIPPTPRSPRGASTRGSPSTRWQRRGSGGGDSGEGAVSAAAVAAAAAGAAAASGSAAAGKIRDEQTQFLSKEVRPTRLRLCIPGSSSKQVIPPLKALERIYACRGCGAFLFTGGHIIKLIELPSIQTILGHSATRCSGDQHAADSTASPRPLFSSSSTSCPTRGVASPNARVSGAIPCGSMGAGGVGGGGSVSLERRSPTPLCLASSVSRISSALPPPLLGASSMEFALERPPVRSRGAEGLSTSGDSKGGASRSGSAGAGGGSQISIVDARGASTGEGTLSQSPMGFTPTPCHRRPWRAAQGGSMGASGRGVRGGGAREGATGRENVFGFENEDNASNMDPNERDMMMSASSPVVMGSFNGGGGSGGSESSVGGAWYSSWESGGGGSGRRRRGRGKAQNVSNAGGTTSTVPPQSSEFSLVLSTKVPSSLGSGMESVSPVMTPRSPRTPVSCGSASPCASEASISTTGRPQSAEKRQFLLRLQLMDTSRAGSGGASAETESQNEPLNSRGTGRWLHVDLLEWMGDITAAPTGRINCPNSACRTELGSWTWEKPEAVGAKALIGPPIIRLDRSLIKGTSHMLSNLDNRSGLSRDSTPRSSPKSASTSISTSSSSPASNSTSVAPPRTSVREAATPETREPEMVRLSSGRLAVLSTVLLRRQHQQQHHRQQPLGSPPE